MEGFIQISVAARTVLGVAVGASITPALFVELPKMAVSIALIPFFILPITLVGVPFFRKVWGFDSTAAFYAAMPGGLQDMIVFGTEAGANPRTLSPIHGTRVPIIVTLAPLFLTVFYDAQFTDPIGEPMCSATETMPNARQFRARSAVFGASCDLEDLHPMRGLSK